MSCIGDNIWLLTNAQELNELPLSQDWYLHKILGDISCCINAYLFACGQRIYQMVSMFLNHCKPMKRCPLKMNSLAFTFAACVLLCNKGRISIEINKLRGHIIHSNLTRLLSYFCISSLTNVSLMRPTEWTSHLLNFFKWNAAEKLFPSKTVHYWWRFWIWLIFIQLSIINYRYM